MTGSRYLCLRGTDINSLSAVDSRDAVVDTVESTLDMTIMGCNVRDAQWVC